MYVDATALEVTDARSARVVVRQLREALRLFDESVRRVQVELGMSGSRHLCRLRAWAERGQTVVVESCAASADAAFDTATSSLIHALGRRTPAERRIPPPVSRIELRSPLQPARDASPDGADGSGADAVRREAASAASTGPEAVPAADMPGEAGAADALPADAAAAELTPSQARRVLLALRDLDASSASLHWARLLGEALDAELDVCRVLPDVPDTSTLPPGQAWLDATRRLLAATRETRRWCGEALPDVDLSERVVAAGAAAVREAAQLVRERGIDWIVIPGALEGCGAMATALARAARCPVLVARAPTTRSTLLVATSGATEDRAVLTRAAQLADILHAPVLALHDVGTPGSPFVSHLDAVVEPWAQIRAERHAGMGERRLPEIDVLLAHGADRMQTILQQARREDAEVLLLGVPPLPSAAADELTAEVAERALQSVLLVPSATREAAEVPRAPAAPELPGPGMSAAPRGRWREARRRFRLASERRPRRGR